MQREKAAESAVLPLKDNLSYRLSRLHFLMGKATAAIYGAEGLTSHQWRVMSVLYHYAPMPASEVGRWVTLDKAAISRAVRQLKAHGLIERRLNESDARAVDIMLTRKGEEVNERMGERIARLQSSIVGSLSEREQRGLFPLLDKLESRFSSLLGIEARPVR